MARIAAHARPIDAVQLAEDFFVMAPLLILLCLVVQAIVAS